MRKFFLLGALPLLLMIFLSGCETPGMNADRAVALAQQQAILQEQPGNYFIGRRYYNPNYKFWGYVRKPGQPWRTATLVMFNENQKLAPDRELNTFGVDDNSEYRLYGRFTGERVYEPASNRVYPEFMLSNAELIDAHPASIFPASSSRLPSTVINQPF